MIMQGDEQEQGAATLHVSVIGSNPLIWRKLAVPVDYSLHDLHLTIQCVMLWDNCHMHEFIVGDTRYGQPDRNDEDDSLLDEEDVTVGAVLSRKGKTITYVYDFGDDWRLTIKSEGSLPLADAPDVPSCLDGANAAPPEDSGGLFGYYRKLEVLADPEDSEYEEVVDWLPPDFDPAVFDVDAANFLLSLGMFDEDDFDDDEGIGEDDDPFDELEVAGAVNDFFASCCGWCRQPIEEDTAVQAQFLKGMPGFDLDAMRGRFMVVPMGATERLVPVYVVPEDSDAHRDGHDFAIQLCCDECAETLRKALAETMDDD